VRGAIASGTPLSFSEGDVQSRLREVAGLLRNPRSLDAEGRRVLAELVEELSAALASANVPPEEVARLAESTVHLAESLQHPHDHGLLGNARDRLEGAAIDAEAHAPLAVGLARRLLDVLANIGI
jgi:hypothetical protein